MLKPSAEIAEMLDDSEVIAKSAITLLMDRSHDLGISSLVPMMMIKEMCDLMSRELVKSPANPFIGLDADTKERGMKQLEAMLKDKFKKDWDRSQVKRKASL